MSQEFDGSDMMTIRSSLLLRCSQCDALYPCSFGSCRKCGGF
jgi:ribosomal protein L40E